MLNAALFSGLVTISIAVLGWAFHTTSSISVLNQKDADITTLINSKFDEVNRRLERMEKAMNGMLKHVD